MNTQIDPQSKKFWNEFVEFESDEIILLGRAHIFPGRGNVPSRSFVVTKKREGTFPSRPRNVETPMEKREQSGSKKGSFGNKRGSFGSKKWSCGSMKGSCGSDGKRHPEEMRKNSRSFKKIRRNLGPSQEQVGRDVGVITRKSYTHKRIGQ